MPLSAAGLGLKLITSDKDESLTPLNITTKYLRDQLAQKRLKVIIRKGHPDLVIRALKDGVLIPTHKDFYTMTDTDFKTLPMGSVEPSIKRAKTSPSHKPP